MTTEQLIIAVGVILLVARVFGWLFRHIGQPPVMGEITAGIILGPSFLGRFFPSAFVWIFPPSSLPTLNSLSQLGLLLFLFTVGLQVDLRHIFKQRAAVILVSNVSILLPLGLGLGLAKFLYPEYGGPNMAFSAFSLFMGTAMSITAFPVLARILKECNLLETELGALAISCAAIDDVSAWLLLAVLTAVARSSHDWGHVAEILFGLAIFVAVMLVPVRRAAGYFAGFYQKYGLGMGLFSALILMMLASAWTTEKLGLHALFGAFMAGLAVPKNPKLISEAVEKIESLALALLLPLFFALTGLRTRIDLLAGERAWIYTAAIIAVAIVGKFAGATLASRATGTPWKDSAALGVLMNTRGLVELVVLNVGLELGILSPQLFTMMVIMALVTTFMAAPVLRKMKITAQPPVQEAASGT
ncbi:MAG: cation:proton antiporter [Acidobacteriia bacterium]|nr:cation:proton antiporter [Terriglobia bacterium]